MRLADQISLRSRRRKFGLFMETMAPTAETTVLDVGVDDFAFGEVSVNEGSCGTLNFFEEMYPWPQQLTAVGQHEGARFRASYPDAHYVQGERARAAVRGRRLRHRLLERRDRARRRGGASSGASSPRRSASAGGRSSRRRTAGSRSRCTRACRSSTGCRTASSHRAYDLARKPWAKQNRLLGPGSFARLFPGEVRIVNLGLSLVAVVD